MISCVEYDSAPAHPTVRGNGELILVVDDEDLMRALIKQILEASGFDVLTAVNGADAAAVYSRHKDAIDVVLTDMVMPVMDGIALTRALKGMNPDVRVIVTSGLSSEEYQSKAIGAGARQFLAKPFETEFLLSSVAEILDDRQGFAAVPISASNRSKF